MCSVESRSLPRNELDGSQQGGAVVSTAISQPEGPERSCRDHI